MSPNNLPPVAGNHTAIAMQDQVLSLPVANLLATDFDPDGDLLDITAVSGLSTNHGTVALASGNITYTPPADYTGADQFSYTLTDSRGASSIGYVLLTVASPPLITSASMAADGSSFLISGAGPAGAACRVVATTNLTLPLSNWIPISTGAFSGGVFNFADPEASNYVFRLYRLITP
jgi:hypothetical protein